MNRSLWGVAFKKTGRGTRLGILTQEVPAGTGAVSAPATEEQPSSATTSNDPKSKPKSKSKSETKKP